MKRILLIAISAFILAGCACTDCKAAPKKHRNVAVQMWSLHKFTFVDAIEKLKGLDIDGIEIYPGQKLGGKFPDSKIHPSMKPEELAYLKQVIKESGFKPVSFGVYGTGNEKSVEAACIFAKELGITRILTEDPVARWEIWDRIGKKYGVKMCVHHHSTTSHNQYYDADLVKKYTKGFDNVMANPDIGHLSRCNIDPLYNVKVLKEEIGSIHFKDQKEFGNPVNKCVPLGKGQLQLEKILKELDKQGYNGFFVLEYEAAWENNVPLIKECVEYLRNH